MRFAQYNYYRHLVTLLLFLPLLMVMLLSGCTSTWKAPVASHETPARQPAKIVSSTQPSRKSHAPAVNNSGIYRVQKGDTLYGIAWQTGVDYKQLAAWNAIAYPYTIFTGQVLRTRASKKVASHSKSRPKKPESRQVSKKVEPVSHNRKNLSWTWPTRGKIIQGFKSRDDTRKGIKLEGRTGQKIVAAESGKVVYSGSGLIGYGKLIIIKHNNTYLSAYGHNRSLKVKEGDQVTKGMQIAEMGLIDDGKPALHFEIRKNGKPINPVALLPGK
ncbi:MAG: peptidoglycan DD-metalloendopeptidase family protein [Chromatiales bacterium]|jgi:lipoprotein NlpD